MTSDIGRISLKRMIEIFLSYDPLSFYKEPLHNLDDSIPKNFTKCRALEGDDYLPEKSSDILDLISKKYNLEGERERREIYLLMGSLQGTRKRLQNFFHKAERNKLPTEVKGEIFWIYLRLCIKDICLFLRHLNS